jgi:hypothetical protein
MDKKRDELPETAGQGGGQSAGKQAEKQGAGPQKGLGGQQPDLGKTQRRDQDPQGGIGE